MKINRHSDDFKNAKKSHKVSIMDFPKAVSYVLIDIDLTMSFFIFYLIGKRGGGEGVDFNLQFIIRVIISDLASFRTTFQKISSSHLRRKRLY